MVSEEPRPGYEESQEDLAESLDLVAAQALLDCFSGLTGLACSITDLSGNILVHAGWQEACAEFHRRNPETNGLCVESDLQLERDLRPGEFRAHRCPNGLQDMATSLYIGGVLCGRVHIGQFLYEGESLDEDFFTARAKRYGFDIDKYLTALRKVPRFSPERAQALMRHLASIVEVVSRLSMTTRELEASERRYRELFQRTPIGYQSLDRDVRFLEVNEAWLDMLGYSREEVIGRSFGEFLGPGMAELLPERYARFLATGHTSTEFEMRRKDGEIITVAFDGKIGYAPDGSFRASHCILANVTERRKAEEILHLTRFAVDHAADGFYWTDAEGRFINVNDAACERLGYSREELLDMYVWDVTVEARQADRAVRWEQIRQEGSLRFERRQRTKSGEVFPVEITVTHFDYGGRGFNFALVRDISERKKVEARESSLREFYELILNRVNDGIWVTDKGDELVYFNPGMEQIAGVSAQEVLGLNVIRDFPPETTARFLEFYHKAKREGAPTPYEAEVVTPTGRFSVQSGWLIPRFEGGVYDGMICTIQDVTERSLAEDALRESEERYRKLFELESDAIILVDDETGRVIEVNEAAVALYGFSRREWLEKEHTDVSAEPDATRAAALSGAVRTPLRWHRKKDGALFPAEITSARLDWKGRSVHIVAIRDITQRIEAEKELRQRDEQLRQSQKMEAIGQLAGGIAHDFNNLLTAILGYSDIVLSEEAVAGAPVAADVQEIKLAAERASALTRQILAFSRRQALQPALVSVNDVVEGMESLLRRTLGEDISLVTELDGRVGMTEVDVHQFEQVIMNLAVNARDAMPSGGRLTLRTGNVELDEHYISTRPEVEPGHYVELTVTDTGVGLDEDTAERMFEPFFTTKAPGEGTGLGLSVVYGIVRQSGGNIEVSSEPGRGTTFKVRLPHVEHQPVEAIRVEAPAEHARGHESILVVEDEPALRSLVARILRGHGYEVAVAADAGEALEFVRDSGGSIDLLLTDVVLPGGMQGNDLVRTLLELYPGLPVLYMSGYTRDAIVHAGRLDEAVNFLEKPFSPARLVEAVGDVLATTRGAAD